MKRRIACILFCGLAAIWLRADDYSRVMSVDPDTAKVGDEVTAKGENLQKAKISEICLTLGNADLKAVITSQSETEIKFKVPKVEPGRYRLTLVTANKASMIEQPVVLTVE